MVGTVFADEGVVWRITESKHREPEEFGTEDVIRYYDHFDNPEFDPPRDECEVSSYDDVKDWHTESHARLTLDPALKPPSIGQDCDKTLEIYREFLYPVMRRQRIKHLVEDNSSPHNSDKIRAVHQQQRITIVGYEETEAEKREIVRRADPCVPAPPGPSGTDHQADEGAAPTPCLAAKQSGPQSY